MSLLLDELDNFGKEAAKEYVELKVSMKKGTSFYTRAAAAFLKGTEDKPAVNRVKVSALGEAITCAAAVATRMEQDSLANIVSLSTSYPQVGEAKRNCAQISICLVRTE